MICNKTMILLALTVILSLHLVACGSAGTPPPTYNITYATYTPHPTSTPPATSAPPQVLAAAPTATLTPAPTVQAPPTFGEVAPHGLNLRSGPSTDHDILQELYRGARLQVLARAPDGIWVVVIAPGGTEGWVHSNYVTVTEGAIEQLPTAEPPPITRPSPILTPMSAGPASSP